jgi:hypothetical protein
MSLKRKDSVNLASTKKTNLIIFLFKFSWEIYSNSFKNSSFLSVSFEISLLLVFS